MPRELPKSGRPLVMGVVNVTPDSFFDGGRYFDPERAVAHALNLVGTGADMVDIGGESTRPGSDPVPLQEELNRIRPVVRGLRNVSDVFISIDTTKAEVALEAIDLGADMVNDVSGLTFDKEMAPVVGQAGASVVVMHMKGRPRNMQENPCYEDVIGEITSFFRERISYLQDHGVDVGRIVLDPGIGFGKRLKDNLAIIKLLHRFKVFGRPILVGTSMKSFIEMATGGSMEDRRVGTVASVAVALWNGADIVRVHDVAAARRVVDLVCAIKES